MKLDPITLKAAVCAGVACLALLPKGAYFLSDKYIRAYNTSSTYLTEVKEKALNKVGLKTIELDEELTHSLIHKEAKNFNVNPKLALALAVHESNDNPDALSLKGAIGIMQIMPDNYKRCGLKYKSDLWIKSKNIKCGIQILSEELVTYKNDVIKALNSYNGGPRCVSKLGDSPCAESRKHAYETLKKFVQSSI